MSHDDAASTHDPEDLSSLTAAASDTFSVSRVFGEAYRQGDALIIPVAVVTGTHGRADAGGHGRIGDGRHQGHHHPASPRPDDEAPTRSGDTDGPRHGAAGSAAAGPSSASASGEPGQADGRGPWGGQRFWGHHRHPGSGRGRGQAAAGGFATHTRPLGVYVVRDGDVSWQPALDLNRVILGGQIVGALVGTALAITLPLARALRRRR